MVADFRRSTFALSIAAACTLAACSSAGSALSPNVSPQSPFSVREAARNKRPDAGTTIKTIVFGKVPAAKGGTAFAKPMALPVVAKNAGGAAITGAYANPISLADADKTGASQLLVNGKPASAKNLVTASTDAVTISYTGLTIAPATLSATAKGAKGATASFAPTIPPIAYTGPKVSNAPEIDLTSNTSGTAGYSGAFTATQAGWSGAPYKKSFTYAFAPIKGQTNNCPGTTHAGYVVAPKSGTTGSAFTVHGASTAAAGECLLKITGGAAASISVTLTYTTTGIGINDRH
jgi:hypothetical protein